jgi:hypothetical protein
MPDALKLVFLVVVTLALVHLYRRRERFIHNFQWLLVCVFGGYLLFLLLRSDPHTHDAALWISLGAAFFLYWYSGPKRSRYIPASVRRRKEAEYILETGKKFNRQKFELDHDVPFSDGGSHTMDNLRVKKRKENRSKGAKPAKWDIFGR